MSEWLGDFGEGSLASAAFWVAAALVLLLGVLIIVRMMRNLSSGTFIAGGRNRPPRLAVVDAAAVDNQRRLVLVRRDDVEHLILIGGPTDIVVEQHIGAAPARAASEAQPAAERARAPQPAAPVRRSQPSDITGTQTASAPRPEPSLTRSEPWPAASPAQPLRNDRIAPAPRAESQVRTGSEAGLLVEKPAAQRRQPTPAAPAAPSVAAWNNRGEEETVRLRNEDVSLHTVRPAAEASAPAAALAPQNRQEEFSIEDEMSRLLDDLSEERKREG